MSLLKKVWEFTSHSSCLEFSNFFTKKIFSGLLFANIFNYTCLNNSEFHPQKLFIFPTKSFVQKSLKALFYRKKRRRRTCLLDPTREHIFDMLILFAFRANFMPPCHPSAIAVTKVINSFQMELKVNLFNVG